MDGYYFHDFFYDQFSGLMSYSSIVFYERKKNSLFENNLGLKFQGEKGSNPERWENTRIGGAGKLKSYLTVFHPFDVLPFSYVTSIKSVVTWIYAA